MEQNRLAYVMNGTVLLILFFALAICVYLDMGWIRALDGFGDSVLRLLIPDRFTNLFIEITNLGDANLILLFSLILVLILFIFKKGIAALWTIFTVLLCGAAVPHLLKVLILRERPVYRVVYAGGYSFPSGHSTIAAVFYGLIIVWTLTYIEKTWLRVLITTLMSVLILLIMWSRVFLGVHYLSDVIGGLLLGVGQILITTGLYWKFQVRARG